MLTGKTSSYESEIGRLRADNLTLSEELTQCQADKEFVWTLWKRLQVANPDITQAVGVVVQREKEKTELKDRKVLEMLQHKDERIEQLGHLVNSQTQEISSLMAQKVHLERKIDKLEAENVDLLDTRAHLHDKLAESDQIRDESASRQAVRELDQENMDLKQQMRKHEDNIKRLIQDKEDLATIRSSQANCIKDLEEDLKAVGDNYDKMAREHTDAKHLLKKYENELTALKTDFHQKSKHLETARKEAADLWKSHSQASDENNQQVGLIRQLHSINKDTQLMLKNQEDTFSLEMTSLRTQNEILQGANTELKRQILEYKKRIKEQDKVVVDLQERIEESFSGYPRPSNATEDRIHNLQAEIDDLREHLSDTRGRSKTRSRPIRDQASSPIKFGSSHRSVSMDTATSPVRFDHTATNVRSHSTGVERDSSHHRENDACMLHKHLDMMQKKLDDGYHLLHMKNQELEEVKRAHDRRLERLRSLAANHKLVRQQLKIMEEENNGKKKRKNLTRCHPKSLQKEDSDKVWNELAYFREEAKNTATENMNLREEMDSLRVKVAHDSATIHELRSCLEQEKEELQELLQERENGVSKEEQTADLDTATQQIQFLLTKLYALQKEMKESGAERTHLLDQRRALRNEVQKLERRDAEHRICTADLRRDVNRLQRELRRRRKLKQGKSTVAKQYQKVLNQSIQKMDCMFDQFNKEGWEDIATPSDNDLDLTEVTCTSGATAESLGAAIASRATDGDSVCGDKGSYSLPVNASTPSPRRTRSRLGQMGNKRLTHCHKKSTVTVTTCDRASSPVHFLSTSSDLDLIPTCESVYHGAAVSPVRFPSPCAKVVQQKSCAVTAPGGRQVAALKQRVNGLQQQVTVIKRAKENAVKAQRELRQLMEQQQGELWAANQRLHTQKLASQRLSHDIERLKSEKQVLVGQLESFTSDDVPHSEQEWTLLQSRLKTTTAEGSRQLATIKQLREENSSQGDKITKLQERLNHSERDVSQKRTLVDDMKIKWKLAQENAQSDADIMLEVENKLKTLGDTNHRYKTQIESFRQRLAAAMKEKYESEDKVIRVSQELDRKNKVVGDLQRKNSELKVTVDEMERTAQEQLHQLANQSEAAIDTAQSRLNQANSLMHEFHKFVKVLSHSLVNGIQQVRSLIRANQQRQADQQTSGTSQDSLAMKQAQSTACDILNLSQSDLEDILNVSQEKSERKSEASISSDKQESKMDRKWVRKWEKLLRSEEFAVPLAEHFLNKIEEKLRLMEELKIS